ncbi:MAG: hypothetical protein ACE3L7_29805 [Candidatus Pristimantibacillus sp.]
MKQFGKRIYYEKATGNVLVTTNDMQGDGVIRPTVEQDKLLYAAFKALNEEAYDYIELEYGQYAQDFADCDGFLVDLTGEQKLLFSYPNPSTPEVPQIYQQPLSEQVASLQANNLTLMEVVADLYEMVLGAQSA